MPEVLPFDEAAYTDHRFYNTKLCSYRKPISYETAMNDIRMNVRKQWEAQKDLLMLETSTISVQSLVLTAHCNSQLKLTQSLQNGDSHRIGRNGGFWTIYTYRFSSSILSINNVYLCCLVSRYIYINTFVSFGFITRKHIENLQQ